MRIVIVEISFVFGPFKMDFKQLLQAFLIIYTIKGCNSTISLNFCSDMSVKDYFDNTSKDTALKLDGSYAAITNTERGTCTCIVTPDAPVPEKLHVDHVYDTKSSDNNACNKNVEVRHGNGELEHLFSCYSNRIEIQSDDLDEGIRFKLNWFGNPGTSDMLHMYIAPESGTVLKVTCFPPLISTTAPGNNGTDSSTVKPSTTVKTFATGETSDSLVVVGVIIGLGLIFLLFISCMLFFIARRKIRSEEMEEKHRGSDQLPSQHKNTINRTLTHLYDKMRANRPLPSIPSSFRNIHPFKSRQQNRSGMYASIKSNNSNARQVLDKQLSESSDCSYLEPIKITTISETVNIKPKELNKSKVTDVSPFETTKERLEMKIKRNRKRSVNDLYIHPQYEVEMESKQKNSIDERDANDRKQSKQMYVNHREVHTIREDSLDQGTPGAVKNDTENIICCPGYMRLDLNSCEDTDQDKNEKENIDNINNGKNTLIETDSSGYMPMSAVSKINKKPVLEQNDSIFPQLIGFTSPYDADINEGKDKESQNDEKHVVKTKRYVKDTK